MPADMIEGSIEPSDNHKKNLGFKPGQVRKSRSALWPCCSVEGVRTAKLNSTQVWGLLNNFPSEGDVWVWEWWLK